MHDLGGRRGGLRAAGGPAGGRGLPRRGRRAPLSALGKGPVVGRRPLALGLAVAGAARTYGPASPGGHGLASDGLGLGRAAVGKQRARRWPQLRAGAAPRLGSPRPAPGPAACGASGGRRRSGPAAPALQRLGSGCGQCGPRRSPSPRPVSSPLFLPSSLSLPASCPTETQPAPDAKTKVGEDAPARAAAAPPLALSRAPARARCSGKLSPARAPHSRTRPPPPRPPACPPARPPRASRSRGRGWSVLRRPATGEPPPDDARAAGPGRSPGRRRGARPPWARGVRAARPAWPLSPALGSGGALAPSMPDS